MDSTFVAHTYERKIGLYRARAYVGSPMANGRMFRHGHTVATADTAEEAKSLVLKRIADIYRRDGLKVPPVVDHGKVTMVALDNYKF